MDVIVGTTEDFRLSGIGSAGFWPPVTAGERVVCYLQMIEGSWVEQMMQGFVFLACSYPRPRIASLER